MVCLLLCGWIALSQHRGSDGGFWYRIESTPMSLEACRAALKRVTTRPKVGMTKWYDVTMPQLEKQFGQPAVSARESWLGCWPEGTLLGEPDA